MENEVTDLIGIHKQKYLQCSRNINNTTGDCQVSQNVYSTICHDQTFKYWVFSPNHKCVKVETKSGEAHTVFTLFDTNETHLAVLDPTLLGNFIVNLRTRRIHTVESTVDIQLESFDENAKKVSVYRKDNKDDTNMSIGYCLNWGMLEPITEPKFAQSFFEGQIISFFYYRKEYVLKLPHTNIIVLKKNESKIDEIIQGVNNGGSLGALSQKYFADTSPIEQRLQAALSNVIQKPLPTRLKTSDRSILNNTWVRKWNTNRNNTRSTRILSIKGNNFVWIQVDIAARHTMVYYQYGTISIPDTGDKISFACNSEEESAKAKELLGGEFQNQVCKWQYSPMNQEAIEMSRFLLLYLC